MGEAEVRVEVAPLVLGLTRPRMFWGVPIGVFVGELMIVVMTFLNTKNLAMFLLFLPLHAAAYVITVRDPHLANVALVRIAKCPWTKNLHFWGGNSYEP
ncbi:VirB3 family type IV secretion system protein [Rhizobium sp. VS19-DR104.2]|uniref:type IV secretion system protein VirB3 n=1 Tax=unclassified Rhizobium TaxID=2613769 RepID=UPI001C5B62C0|nr:MULTISPECIES: VirB3 family type IV secretion system protein [unclassified Rhizobium]MBZ5763367.1 VirB3 family type IV secretion system protein [Rhizobium sp. VS19-DR96]MBZ5769263.1 VirB3 family type IV secretion system protein [Rhizobium sp. VS19-DR129.2]MBZ5776809.1 VirB3 family type IV secretion system protein [Rhizobium sp. VS19-DRK62.2]MBZ5787886.1 VirB3 family type IV secretion system protein [Rhizobium sp. VS19-DR121]MBZ5805387.1 VirB3 family type IV secretion system protein [Rhizobiu